MHFLVFLCQLQSISSSRQSKSYVHKSRGGVSSRARHNWTCFLCFVHPIFLSFGFWYFGHFSCVIFFQAFFPSCPSCLAKCKQRSRNIFVTLLPKVNKNQKRKVRWTKHYLQILSVTKSFSTSSICNCHVHPILSRFSNNYRILLLLNFLLFLKVGGQ